MSTDMVNIRTDGTNIIKIIQKSTNILLIEYDVPEGKLDEREIFWIKFFDSYNNGYNLTEGGSSTRGYKHTEEYKLYMSKLHSGSGNPFYNNHSLAGKNHPMYGKRGELSPMYGRKWFNNGIVQIRSFECPIGFTKGMLKK